MTDQGAAQRHEGEVDVGTALVTDHEAPELRQPGERALDDPAVTTQPLRGLDAAASDATEDAARSQAATTDAMVVGFVGMQLSRSMPWAATLAIAHGRHQIQHPLEQ